MLEVRDFNFKDIQDGYSDKNTFILDNLESKKDFIQILFRSNKDQFNDLDFSPSFNGYRGKYLVKDRNISYDGIRIDMSSVICIKSIEQ